MSLSDQRSDAELVSQCNTGNREEAILAFETLYARHKDYVLRVAYRYLRDADLALDVLQETFTYVLRKFPPPGDGLVLTAQLRTLLYTVAKSHSISCLRKNSRIESSVEFDPDAIAAPQREDREVGELMAGLSPKQREIINLRFVDDLALGDIAETLGIPVGTVKSRLHGAIRELRNSPFAREFFEK